MTPVMNVDFDHIRLSDVDDTRKPLDENVYTLEINKLDPTTRTIGADKDHPLKGQTVPVLQGSFTVVESGDRDGFKLWQDLWISSKDGLVGAKKIQQATGVQQTEGQSVSDWASQFSTLNPPARIQALVKNLGPDAAKPNRINLFTIKPVA